MVIKRLAILVAAVPVLTAQSTTSPCDLNGDGVVNVADVQIAVNEVLGLAPCTMNLDGTGACDIIDVQRVISAALGGTCVVTGQASANITLPVEVMGPAGATNSVSFSIPASSSALLSGTQTLSLQIHGLKYETEASVQVNSSAWMAINSTNATIQGLGAAYGGIGGGFHTLSLTMSLPAGTVTTGNNTVNFSFNGTDGATSGYRVLALNVVGSDGATQLIPSSTFVWDDPGNWQPPSSAASDISAGQSLYTSAALTVPNPSGGTATILAHCSDCHAIDGRDLKYFNYSNNSIEVRSQFHGLTAQQGQQIASYIRSLDMPNPGRPWNPPYQPGPGMDSQPVANWAAGAGLSAVLDADGDMQAYLAPNGSTADWAANQYLNPREIPVALQLLDWNGWLPPVHPMDAYGSTFTSSTFNTFYWQLRSELTPNSTASYANALNDFVNWKVARETDFDGVVIGDATSAGWNATNRQSVYAVGQWNMVKLWELNQEFGLESMPQVPFGSKANVRGWYGNEAFFTSPNMLQISPGPGLGNGSQITKDYLAYIWYHLQLVLNDGQGQTYGQDPIDFPYVYGFTKGLNWDSPLNPPEAMLQLLWQVKSDQAETLTAIGPQVGSDGWQPTYTIPEPLVDSAWADGWSATPASTRATLMQACLQAWFNQISTYTPQQFYQGGWASASDNPQTLNPEVTFGGMLWSMLPRFRYYGVAAALTQQIGNWAATIWPNGNWALNNSATCNAQNQCTSD